MKIFIYIVFFLTLLALLNIPYSYEISSLIITIQKEKVFLTISVNVNKTLDLKNILPENCRVDDIYSPVPYQIENNRLNILGLENKTYNILIKANCAPLLEASQYKFIYYINNSSKPLDIYLIHDENIKIMKLSPKFKIDNGIFTSTIKDNDCKKILIEYNVLESSSINIFYLILILSSLLLSCSLIIVFQRYKLKIKNEKKKENILLNALKHCKTDFEKKIIEYLYNKNYEAYQFEIYKDLNLNKSTVSKILRRLEEKMIIERKPWKKGILVKLRDQPSVEGTSTQDSNK